jgi:PAS domain S-box-containing protein
MLPYRTQDNHIAGVVVNFSDITDRKRAKDESDDARNYSETIVETIRHPLLILNEGLRVESANQAFFDQFKTQAPETLGKLVYELGNGQWDIPKLRKLLGEVVSTERRITDFEVEHEFLDIGRRHMLLNADKLVRGGERDNLILLAIEDITERKHAEDLKERFAAIVRFSEDAIIGKDLDGIIMSWNRGAERLLGYTSAEIIGQSIKTLVPTDRHPEEMEVLRRIRQGEHLEHFETTRQRKDGSEVWVSLTISPLKDATGTVIGASTIARDMTDRRRAEEHRNTLMRELNHRVKNTLAIVQSIATQTLRQASTMEDASDTFAARLSNLGKAHNLLTRESWGGANLAEIVADTLKTHANSEKSFHFEGQDFQVAPSPALAFAMALHELATNATKYGALSVEGGHVDVAWDINGKSPDRRLTLRWAEHGGPRVVPPKQRGFGSTLIERSLSAELQAEVRIEYDPSGVVCTFNVPIASIQSDGEK